MRESLSTRSLLSKGMIMIKKCFSKQLVPNMDMGFKFTPKNDSVSVDGVLMASDIKIIVYQGQLDVICDTSGEYCFICSIYFYVQPNTIVVL